MIPIFMENNLVFGVHMHNLFSYENKIRKRKIKSKKACLLKKYSLSFKSKSAIKNPKSSRLVALVFFVLKICHA